MYLQICHWTIESLVTVAANDSSVVNRSIFSLTTKGSRPSNCADCVTAFERHYCKRCHCLRLPINHCGRYHRDVNRFRSNDDHLSDGALNDCTVLCPNPYAGNYYSLKFGHNCSNDYCSCYVWKCLTLFDDVSNGMPFVAYAVDRYAD